MDGWTTESAGGVSLDRPDGWLSLGDHAGAELALSEPPRDETEFAANVNVVRVPIDPAIDLDSFTSLQLERVTRFLTDFQLLDAERLDTDAGPATRVLGVYRQGLYSLTIEQHMVLAGDEAFVVTATAESDAYDALADGLARILHSFKPGRG